MNNDNQRIYCGLLVALILLLSACNGGGSVMSDDEREIAIAVALTQTAVAIDEEANGQATDEEVADSAAPESDLSTPAAPAEESTATPLPAEPTATPEPTVAAADAAPDNQAPASEPEPTAQPAALTAANLPVTQNQAKVRTLLVAPGEPGALYALLTDEADASAPARGARLLVSRNFGESWDLSPSGLPVADDCLMNVNMDYYGDTALYASTCEGIYRWAPGEEWTLVSSEVTGMVAVVYGNENTIWATRPYAPEGAPVLVSQNGGESWNEIAISGENGVANLGISPRESRNVYAIVWPTGDGSYLRRGSALTEWQTVPTPAENTTINTGMTIDGGTGWLYVTTANADGDRLWRSTDADTPIVGDVGWTMVHQFAPGLTAELLASGWSPEENALTIYANLSVTTDGNTQSTLVRSTDSGQTWEPLIIDAG